MRPIPENGPITEWLVWAKELTDRGDPRGPFVIFGQNGTQASRSSGTAECYDVHLTSRARSATSPHSTRGSRLECARLPF
jgi:hypothetical protein